MKDNNLFTLILILTSAIIIFLERAFPFLLFSRKKIPNFIGIVEKTFPPLIMACLFFYCLKDIKFINHANIYPQGFLPQLISISLTIILHLIKRNAFLSISIGTICYMLIINFI